MLGKSSRFFNAGYVVPKFQLVLREETIFSLSTRSFEKYFKSEAFLFLVRKDYESKSFVAAEVNKLGIKDYRIIEFSSETRGQADSVFIGLRNYHDDVPLLIFNIDTIRYNFCYPLAKDTGDGFLEVFKGEGENWSFIEPGAGTSVLRTTEKERISDLCSNGLYFFSRTTDFREAFDSYISSGNQVQGELYVAPLYNYLILHGRDIRYQLVESSLINHCGTPEDYERLKLHNYF